MENINNLLYLVHLYIKRYPVLYFTISFSLLIFMVMLYIYNRNKFKNKIKRIKTRINTNPEKGIKKLENCDLKIIDYFLNPEHIESDTYIKIKKYFSRPEKAKEIYKKINQENININKFKYMLSIFTKLQTPQVIDYMLTYLYNDNYDIIKLTIENLSKIKTDKVIYSFIELVKYGPDINIVSLLKKSFLEFGPDAAKKLVPILKSNVKPDTKIWCVDVLSHYPQENFASVLLSLLQDNNYEVKINTLKALENFKSENTYTEVIKCLENEHWGVKSQAAKVLGELNVIKAAPNLAKLLSDESGVVREAATNALTKLGYEGMAYLIKEIKKPLPSKEVIKILKKQELTYIIDTCKYMYSNNNSKESAL